MNLTNFCSKFNMFSKANRTYKSRITLASLITCTALQAFAMPGEDFIPPKYTTVDKNGVNLTSGQVTHSTNTVSIGGETGLSHSISVHTNKFLLDGNHAWIDKYAGSSQMMAYGNNVMIDGTLVTLVGTNVVHVMRVSAMGDSTDFKVIVNDQWEYMPDPGSTTHTYEATGDERHTLEDIATGRLWTKPDGTKVYFGGTALGKGYFEKIVYPNGFTIEVSRNLGVSTNTGFQLKYHYVEDNSLPNQSEPVSSDIPPDFRKDWSLSNPKYIHAVNTAVEYCDIASITACDYNYSWPKATFTLPAGMPRVMFEQESKLKVEDASGAITEYRYEPHDLSLEDPHNPNSEQKLDYVYKGRKLWPRLVGIKEAGHTNERFQYFYDNDFAWFTYDHGTSPYLVDETGVLKYVKKYETQVEGNYKPSKTRQGQGAPKQILGRQMRVIGGENPSTLLRIEIDGDRTIHFEENSFRNFVTSVSNKNGPGSAYKYGPRNNITEIKKGSGTYTAEYPLTCDNRKTCNKPLWTQDVYGNKNLYTYHPESGQVLTVTSPANEQGLVAQTRFDYKQETAKILNASGQKVDANSSIWLKAKESYCVNSNYTNGACELNDEVVSVFEYNHDNLLMTGMTVTSGGKTLRTCYSYDIYGNKIGETTPKANLSSCEQGSAQ